MQHFRSSVPTKTEGKNAADVCVLLLLGGGAAASKFCEARSPEEFYEYTSALPSTAFETKK